MNFKIIADKFINLTTSQFYIVYKLILFKIDKTHEYMLEAIYMIISIIFILEENTFTLLKLIFIVCWGHFKLYFDISDSFFSVILNIYKQFCELWLVKFHIHGTFVLS